MELGYLRLIFTSVIELMQIIAPKNSFELQNIIIFLTARVKYEI